MFNRYGVGRRSGSHVDDGVRGIHRTDVSVTLALSNPDDPGGGALIAEDCYGSPMVKPAGSLEHGLRPAGGRRGNARVERRVLVGLQSMIRDAHPCSLIVGLDILRPAGRLDHDDAGVKLTGVSHNLLRQWADV